MSFISNAFAQTAGASSAGPLGNLTSFLPLVLMFVVLYFIMIRPQMKRQKEHRNMLAAIAKGDEIVTSGGMAGRVTKVGETFITVEIAENVEINVQKGAITTLLPKGTLKAL
ncbi:preprotein translocase subunit YajC [Pandoraea terrae]|uniref:Sec translocon accessory complex subunit YajC n=1 Tax=Pandoraea terrae TaxID=1537710 RepID=A0A5E4ZG16_9BURK|nr:preprotein translocase subunit YajC [Pandoraea terrae]VVE59123.1 preprotein translocase subunit YajC [Pandoraea terrae]